MEMVKVSKNNVDWLEQSYRPSWYDRFAGRIDRSRLPGWIIYLLIPILWILLAAIVQRLEGSGTILDWEPISFVAIAQIGYTLFATQLLDKLALKALDEFKPALKIDQEKFPNLERLLSTLPAGPTLLASISFGMVGVVMIITAIFANLDSVITVDASLFGVVTALTMFILWVLNGVFFYHTLHQLRVVDYILTSLTIVHPFHQRELFAFSGFSAQTGIAIVLTTPLWIIFDPGMVSLVIAIIFAFFGLIAFLSPLIGVHKILAKEKDRLIDENAKQVEKTIETLMAEMQKEQPEGLKLADQQLSSLEKARGPIERISTWPWRIETLRQFLAAITLPIIIWLLQYFLAKLLT